MNTTETSGPQPLTEENRMNAPSPAPSQAMNIRLSRISYPRATWWAMLLLVAVFLLFGLWAEASLPAAQTSDTDWQTSLAAGVPWVAEISTIWR